MRYRAVISYFGARYVGWQRQLNGLSVQEVLERALEKIPELLETLVKEYGANEAIKVLCSELRSGAKCPD